MRVRGRIAGIAIISAALVSCAEQATEPGAFAPSLAGVVRMDVCHVDATAGTYQLITVNENAFDSHVAHGDREPGGFVPGTNFMVFGAACTAESTYGVINSVMLNYGDGGWGGWSAPTGRQVMGGGFKADGPAAVSTSGQPSSAWPHYTFAATEWGWVVRDAPNGAGSNSIVYAVYANVPGYDVVDSNAMSFGDGGYGGWSCQPGKVVIGGGFDATGPVTVSAPGKPGSVWPHYTFGAEESGWVVQDAPDGVANTITVYAICASPLAGYEVVNSTAMAFGDTGFGGWSCPAGKIVTGGGFASTRPVATSAPGARNSVWPHYTFGEAEYGWVVAGAPDGAGSTTTVYAVCASM